MSEYDFRKLLERADQVREELNRKVKSAVESQIKSYKENGLEMPDDLKQLIKDLENDHR